jgi:hypothetical protein
MLVEQPGKSTDEGSSWHKPNRVGEASFTARCRDELYASRHGSYSYQNLGGCEQVLAIYSRRNNAVDNCLCRDRRQSAMASNLVSSLASLLVRKEVKRC